MSTTFAVTKNLKQMETYFNKKDLKTAFQQQMDMKFEAVGGPKEVILHGPLDGFFGAWHMAFGQHLPLVLSPDHVWLTIERTFAKHITMNAELLRDQIAGFDGKKQLAVRRDSFRKGAPDNDWVGCFGEFSLQIEEHFGKMRKLTVANFSTTGETEKASSEIVLMDAVSSYCDYSVHTLCGIPQVTLLGTSKDWEDIYNRTQVLAEYGLEWWTKVLLPVLDQFVQASRGAADSAWWESFYKEFSASGGGKLDGHILAFAPDLENETIPKRTSITSIPSAVSKVPFIWNYMGKVFNMELVAGLPFVVLNADGSVQPAAAWGVREAT